MSRRHWRNLPGCQYLTHYYSKWVESAKTEPTKTKRIAMVVDAMYKGNGLW
ncbi:MAG: YdeI/OmpD-associated family protein [Bacteroidota bacterium]